MRGLARLAVMLAQGAAWLLSDEPSAALYLARSQELTTALRDLTHRQGKGVVIALLCDDLAAMRAGRSVRVSRTWRSRTH